VVSRIFSTKQDAAAACTLPYHMESMLIFVSFRSISQTVSDDDRSAKNSGKNADGKKHMFILEHNLYQIRRRPLTIAITGVPHLSGSADPPRLAVCPPVLVRAEEITN